MADWHHAYAQASSKVRRMTLVEKVNITTYDYSLRSRGVVADIALVALAG